jgi:hypothetical protein
VSADLSPHADLFILTWMRASEQLLADARQRGVFEPHAIEMSAWCAEIHEQLRLLAEQRDMPLLLMGGHGTALRVEAAKQRGSRDNDYLTTADEPTINALMDALQAKFADRFQAPLFRHRRLHGGEDAEPLPLASFAVDVPSLIDPNNAVLAVKVEFHIETDTSLFPDGEPVHGAFYGLSETVNARIPRLPYQVALKLMPLHEPPVGLLSRHEPAFPRQMWDVDILTAQINDRLAFLTLAAYAQRRYAKEESQRDREAEADGPWAGIVCRLTGWTPLSAEQWRLIDQFQSAQLSRSSRRPREQWAARVARLRVLCRLLAAEDFATWQRALTVERSIPKHPQPSHLRSLRTTVASIAGTPAKSLGQFPRGEYWRQLADADDIVETLNAFERALSAAGA